MGQVRRTLPVVYDDEMRRNRDHAFVSLQWLGPHEGDGFRGSAAHPDCGGISRVSRRGRGGMSHASTILRSLARHRGLPDGRQRRVRALSTPGTGDMFPLIPRCQQEGYGLELILLPMRSSGAFGHLREHERQPCHFMSGLRPCCGANLGAAPRYCRENTQGSCADSIPVVQAVVVGSGR